MPMPTASAARNLRLAWQRGSGTSGTAAAGWCGPWRRPRVHAVKTGGAAAVRSWWSHWAGAGPTPGCCTQAATNDSSPVASTLGGTSSATPMSLPPDLVPYGKGLSGSLTGTPGMNGLDSVGTLMDPMALPAPQHRSAGAISAGAAPEHAPASTSAAHIECGEVRGSDTPLTPCGV